MLEVQRKKFDQALAVLSLLGTKFKVITPDGEEYGELEVKPVREKVTKGGLPRYGHCETRNFFRDKLVGVTAGQVKMIDCGPYDPRVISRDVSSYCCQTFGKGSASVHMDIGANAVQVFALTDFG
jgi:hypothetical protein